MKFTKLSLIAALAVSSAVAGGDITPAPAPAPETQKTTISGKLTAYYITADADNLDIFSKDGSQLGWGATLDVSHNFTENIAVNLTALGYTNSFRDEPREFGWITNGYFESNKQGALFNVANVTATFMDTTFILGRQLLDTPMLGGFDWLLAPGAFEAYTFANNSFENLTLIGSYLRTWRPNNSGDDWIELRDIENGNNWALGAVYDNKTISGNLWYYNVDAGEAITLGSYKQVYVDGGYNFEVAKLEAQYVYTDYNPSAVDDSNAFGIKASGTFSQINLMAAYEYVSDSVVGYVGRDTLYTSSWNTFTSNSVGNAFKVEAGGELAGLTGSVSYAYYEYDQEVIGDEGYEVDVILGYDFKNTDIVVIKDMDINLVYSNTDYGLGDDINTLEIYANYKF